MAILGLVLGVVASFIVPKSYSATTTVFGDVISTNPFSSSASFDSANEVEVAQSSEVIQSVAGALKVDPTEVRDHLRVVAVDRTQVLNFGYSAANPEQARAGADAAAAAYLKQRSTRAQAQVKAAVAHVDAEIATLMTQYEGLAAEKPAAGSPEALILQGKRQALMQQLNSLAAARATLQQVDTTGGSVLTPAGAVEVTESPSAIVVAASGLVLGALIGLVVAFARSARSGRVRDDSDIEAATGLRVIAQVGDTAGPQDDAVLTVREQIRSVVSSPGALVAVLDFSDSPSSNLAVMLGQSMAQAGEAVEVLVAGNRPAVSVNNLPVHHVGVDQFAESAAHVGVRLLSAATADGNAAIIAAQRVCDVAVIVVGDGTALNRLRDDMERFSISEATLVGAVHRTGAPVDLTRVA